MSRVEGELFFLHEENDSLRAELGTSRSEMKKMSEDLVTMRAENDGCRKENEELEMYSRRNSIRVFGIREEDKESCEQQVIGLCKTKLGINLAESDIDRAHRIGPSWQRNPDPRRPRAILVKFVRHNVKSEVIHKRRLLKGSNVAIREDLTSYRQHLLTDIRGLPSIQAAWSYDGHITALHNDCKFTVRDRSDLENLRAIVISGA